MSAAQAFVHTMALEHSKAQSAYKRAFRQYVETLESLDDETFWKLLDHLRNLLIQRGIQGQALKRAVDEFFRLPYFWRGCQRGTCGGGSDPGYTTIDAIRFAKTFDEMKNKLYKPLFEVIEGRGDDGYSDLLDSLVLLGRDVYTECVGDGDRSNYGNMDAFDAACNKAAAAHTKDAKSADRLSKFVLNGENYVEMSLMDEAEKQFVYHAIDEEREQKCDDFEEDLHSEF